MLGCMQLYTFYRSSAAYRVRIALQLKGLEYESVPVHLLRGEQHSAGYQEKLADALVPALITDGGQWLTQSMAIMEYLEDAYPDVPLLPKDALGRAHARALAQMIACDIHPLNNLRVLKYLVGPMGVAKPLKDAWYAHWVRSGLEAFERQLALLEAERTAQGLAPSRFCWGDAPGLADCCLIPQVFNAQAFGVSVEGLGRLQSVVQRCLALPAFQRAHPEACADAE